MKTLFITLLAAFACFSGFASALTPVGERSETIKFSSRGTPGVTIVAQPANPAAKELADGLSRITGAKFAIQPEKPKNGNYIELVNDAKLPPEAFRIDGKDGNLTLSGGPDNGILNAVLALLEEDLGCRWYGQNLDFYPNCPELTKAIAIRSDAPAFRRRNPFTYLAYNREFCRRNRVMYNNNEFGYLHGWFCHSYESIFPRSSFSEKPDVFMLDEKGKRDSQQLCPSNPLVRETAVAAVLKALRANRDPSRTLVGMSQNDYPIWCHCPECKACIKRYGNAPVAPHLELVNQVARAIAKEFPQTKLVILGYHQTQLPPVGMKIEPNIRIWFCTTDDPNPNHTNLIPVRQSKTIKRNLETWRQLVPEIEIWDYMVDFSNYFMPYPSVYAIADNLLFFHENKCVGVMVQGMRESRGGDRNEMRAWVLSKLLWNPDRDMRELVRDFNHGVYGAAGPWMDQYFDLVEAAGAKGKKLLEFYTPKEFIDKATPCFDGAIDALRRAGQADLIPRVELEMMPLALMKMDWIINHPDRFDSGEFTKILNFISTVADRENIRVYRENLPMKAYIANCRIWLDGRQGKRTIRVSPEEMILFRDIEAEKVKDPLAESQLAARQKCNSQWAIQWPIPTASLRPGTLYKVRALVRTTADANSDSICWTAGIYDNDAHKGLLETNVSGKRLSAKKYTWIELGKFKPPKSGFFWSTAPKAPGTFGPIWVECIELEPVK